VIGALLLATTLAVSVGGPADDPAYLPVHAAAALGTFEAEGVQVALRRAKHPASAVETLREGGAAVAVITADQAVRGAWARGTPVRILVAHRAAPAVALLVSSKHAGRVTGIPALRGQRVGMAGPGTTSHLALLALLKRHKLGPTDAGLTSFGSTALVTRLAAGELAAAMLEEPWASRAIASGAGTVLVDLRQPEDAARHLGGPFYEVVSVAAADDKRLAELEAPLTAYARALQRVQHWLATTPPAAVAARLPAGLVGDPERFAARLEAARAGYAPQGHATDAGLTSTLEVLRGGTPWPVTLKLEPEGLREPAFVTAARAALGPTPPAP
jgi:NitT/TauT family transport system substrate-binding protein